MTVRRSVAAFFTILRRGAAIRWAIVGGACLTLFNCAGSTLQRGAEFYAQRRYIDAAQVFEYSEAELARYDGVQRAHYGLYRGATLLALGDMDDARHWLEYGESFASVSLSAAERRALIEALMSNAPSPQPNAAALAPASAPIGGQPPLTSQPTAVPSLLTSLPLRPAAPRTAR